MEFLSLLGRHIYLDINACNTNELFEIISELMSASVNLNPKDIKEHLLIRENLGSTGLGMGIAIPHARIKYLQQTIISFIRTRNSIDFKAPDGLGVRIFMFILVPENVQQEHLNLLSYIANMLSNDDVRQTFEQSYCVEDIQRVLKEYKQKTFI